MFIAAAAIVAVACTPTQEQETKPEDNLNITSTTFVIPFSGGTQDIVFKTNADWTITSDKDFVTFDRASGSAGTITVTMTVAENIALEPRTADVTVKSGDKQTVFKVQQAAITGVETSIAYNISEAAQDIEIQVASNTAYKVEVDENSPWLTVAQTKAEMSSGVIKIHAAANTSLGPRTGSFAVGNDNFKQNYVVTQTAAWTPTASASATYISNSQMPYDSNTWTYNLFQQWVVELETEGGDAITLVLNKNGFTYNEETYAYEGEYFDATVLPEGEYEIDAAGQYIDNTFSIKSVNGVEKYYTKLVIDGREVTVVDGQVGVVATDEGYAITAALVDLVGTQYNYSFEGTIDVEEELSGRAYDLVYRGLYNTYYGSKTNEWSFGFHIAKPSAEGTAVSYASFTIYTAAGEPASYELPVGTFTYAEPGTADLAYANGKSLAQAGTFSYVYFNVWGESGAYETVNNGTLTIEKNDDGTYSISFNGEVLYNDYSGGEYEPETISFAADIDGYSVADTEKTSKPQPDEEPLVAESALGTYQGYSYGDRFDTGGDIVLVGYSTANTTIGSSVSIYLFVEVSSDDWVFEANFRNKYCITPLPDGVYTYSATAGDHFAILPVYNTALNSCYFTNSYTGTKFWINGGTMTLGNGMMTFDLQGISDSGVKNTLTGSLSTAGTVLFQNRQDTEKWPVELRHKSAE